MRIETWPTPEPAEALSLRTGLSKWKALKARGGSEHRKAARDTGLPGGELIENGVIDFVEELAFTQGTLDGRYDDLERGKIQPVPGAEFFARLRSNSAERKLRNANCPPA